MQTSSTKMFSEYLFDNIDLNALGDKQIVHLASLLKEAYEKTSRSDERVTLLMLIDRLETQARLRDIS